MDLSHLQYIGHSGDVQPAPHSTRRPLRTRAHVYRESRGQWFLAYFDGQQTRHIPFATAHEAWRLIDTHDMWTWQLPAGLVDSARGLMGLTIRRTG